MGAAIVHLVTEGIVPIFPGGPQSAGVILGQDIVVDHQFIGGDAVVLNLPNEGGGIPPINGSGIPLGVFLELTANEGDSIHPHGIGDELGFFQGIAQTEDIKTAKEGPTAGKAAVAEKGDGTIAVQNHGVPAPGHKILAVPLHPLGIARGLVKINLGSAADDGIVLQLDDEPGGKLRGLIGTGLHGVGAVHQPGMLAGQGAHRIGIDRVQTSDQTHQFLIRLGQDAAVPDVGHQWLQSGHQGFGTGRTDLFGEPNGEIRHIHGRSFQIDIQGHGIHGGKIRYSLALGKGRPCSIGLELHLIVGDLFPGNGPGQVGVGFHLVGNGPHPLQHELQPLQPIHGGRIGPRGFHGIDNPGHLSQGILSLDNAPPVQIPAGGAKAPTQDAGILIPEQIGLDTQGGGGITVGIHQGHGTVQGHQGIPTAQDIHQGTLGHPQLIGNSVVGFGILTLKLENGAGVGIGIVHLDVVHRCLQGRADAGGHIGGGHGLGFHFRHTQKSPIIPVKKQGKPIDSRILLGDNAQGKVQAGLTGNFTDAQFRRTLGMAVNSPGIIGGDPGKVPLDLTQQFPALHGIFQDLESVQDLLDPNAGVFLQAATRGDEIIEIHHHPDAVVAGDFIDHQPVADFLAPHHQILRGGGDLDGAAGLMGQGKLSPVPAGFPGGNVGLGIRGPGPAAGGDQKRVRQVGGSRIEFLVSIQTESATLHPVAGDLFPGPPGIGDAQFLSTDPAPPGGKAAVFPGHPGHVPQLGVGGNPEAVIQGGFPLGIGLIPGDAQGLGMGGHPLAVPGQCPPPAFAVLEQATVAVRGRSNGVEFLGLGGQPIGKGDLRRSVFSILVIDQLPFPIGQEAGGGQVVGGNFGFPGEHPADAVGGVALHPGQGAPLQMFKIRGPGPVFHHPVNPAFALHEPGTGMGAGHGVDDKIIPSGQGGNFIGIGPVHPQLELTQFQALGRGMVKDAVKATFGAGEFLGLFRGQTVADDGFQPLSPAPVVPFVNGPDLVFIEYGKDRVFGAEPQQQGIEDLTPEKTALAGGAQHFIEKDLEDKGPHFRTHRAGVHAHVLEHGIHPGGGQIGHGASNGKAAFIQAVQKNRGPQIVVGNEHTDLLFKASLGPGIHLGGLVHGPVPGDEFVPGCIAAQGMAQADIIIIQDVLDTHGPIVGFKDVQEDSPCRGIARGHVFRRGQGAGHQLKKGNGAVGFGLHFQLEHRQPQFITAGAAQDHALG